MRTALGAALALFALVPTLALAQSDGFDPTVFGTNLSIAFSPQYPQPGQTVHLTVQGTGLDLAGSTIVWRKGTTAIAQGMGVTSADITAGGLGSETVVEADVAGADGSIRSAQATIAPTQLDLLIGSDSYTPPFYRGRALPTAGTNIIAQASAKFVRTDGSAIADSDIAYTWKQDGSVLGSLSGRGRSSAVIPVMHLFTPTTIEVDAASTDGSRSGQVFAVIPPVQPVLDLYEDHPLYGILYNLALPSTARITDSEMTFAAAPYFAQAAGANDSGLSYAWRVNGEVIPSSASSPSELTVNAANSTGEAYVELETTHATNFYFDAQGAWDIRLSTNAAQHGAFAPAQ
jgi:hypothetical protein